MARSIIAHFGDRFHVHNDEIAGVPRNRDRLERGIELAAALTGFALVTAPRLSQAVQPVLAVVPVLALAASSMHAKDVLRRLPLVVVVGGAFGLYLAVNATWAVDPGEAYAKVGYYWLLAVLSTLAATGMAATGRDRLEALARGILIGVALGGAILAVETAFNQPLRRLAFNVLPLLRPPRKHIQVDGGAVTQVGLYTLNRSVAILCLALWPALLLARSLLSRQAWIAAAAAGGLVTAIAVFTSEHETSMLALVFSAATFLGMLVARPVVRALVLAGWLVATLLVVPIATASYGAGLHTAGWIPTTGRNRIILWGFTASEVRKAPVLGIGVGSTKELDEQAAETAAKPADHTYPLRTGRHSHNVFMQTWYELGGIGAVLLAAFGITALLALYRVPRVAEPFAVASFVAAVVIGAFSWGMWQTWFMAAYGVWLILLLMAVELVRRSEADATPATPR